MKVEFLPLFTVIVVLVSFLFIIMDLLALLFWIGVFTIFYTYAGYAFFLWIYTRAFQKKKKGNAELPAVTLIVPVFNEEDIIELKIKNSLSLNYPREKLQFLFINDGSTDATEAIGTKFSEIKWLSIPHRMGKISALNQAMKIVTTPVVVFSDANSMLDEESIRKLVRHFADEKVGGVSGEKKIKDSGSVISSSEKLYWQYESFLKKVDSDYYSVVGADGALYSIRSTLYRPVKEDVILDDFFISTQICLEGYLFIYEPDAFALETSSVSIKDEQQRKVRISAGCFQAFVRLPALLNLFRNFKLSLIYISHRLLRWVVCPVLLPVLFILNGILAYHFEGIYVLLMVLQGLFYLLATIGFALKEQRIKAKFLFIPYYFFFMNYSIYLGILRFLNGKQTVLWEKPHRFLRKF